MSNNSEQYGAHREAHSVTILGSTGSIGTQAIELIAAHPDRFHVDALAAGGSNIGLLARQVAQVGAHTVALSDDRRYDELRDALSARGVSPRIVVGADAATQVAGGGSDIVLNGITGSVGLEPTLAALAAGSRVALANKESMVAGGPLVRAARQHPGQIVPVDSEHSAIAQCLRAGDFREVRRLIVTASGGPFRDWTSDQLVEVTPEQALQHPNFAMGQVITTNSATLVNKGLEVIEAHMLFDVPMDRIDVVVHPQQMIHSMVEFCDGATMAQAGIPRMGVPIALGLSWPDRLPDVDQPIDWSHSARWDFAPLDDGRFPAVALARSAVLKGLTHPAVYNAANEEAVAAFHQRKIRFPDIVDIVAEVLEAHGGMSGETLTLDAVLAAQDWARAAAQEEIRCRV